MKIPRTVQSHFGNIVIKLRGSIALSQHIWYLQMYPPNTPQICMHTTYVLSTQRFDCSYNLFIHLQQLICKTAREQRIDGYVETIANHDHCAILVEKRSMNRWQADTYDCSNVKRRPQRRSCAGQDTKNAQYSCKNQATSLHPAA